MWLLTADPVFAMNTTDSWMSSTVSQTAPFEFYWLLFGLSMLFSRLSLIEGLGYPLVFESLLRLRVVPILLI